jgi:hypothetical protein
MEVERFSKTSVHTRTTRGYIPENGYIHGNEVFPLFFDRRRQSVFIQHVLYTNTSELTGRYTSTLNLMLHHAVGRRTTYTL